MSGSQRSSSSTSRLISESSLISHTPGCLSIVEFRQGFQLLLRRARQHDALAFIADLQRCIRHGDQAAADAEKAANLYDCEQHAILDDDQIVELTEFLVCLD